MMNLTKLIYLGVFFILFLSSSKTYGQRVIVKRPARTVVVAPSPAFRVIRPFPAPRVRVTTVVPSGAVIITYGGIPYSYYGGVYYRYYGGQYIIVTPPVGMQVNTLPVEFDKILVDKTLYYYADGVFYLPIDKQYEIVDAPIDAIIYSLPKETQKVSIDNVTYYSYNKTLYLKIQTQGGRAYKVMGTAPENAVSQPEQYTTIEVDDTTYYFSEGVFYILLDGQYKIVGPPKNAIVWDLPQNLQELVIDDKTLYAYKNVLYSKVETDANDTAYKIIGELSTD
ncbi:DUF6515 family protein [Winogradskyella endarachnes]|uniref:Uncharacterized protein n=1 Tax=Winogradskyella endarachnes TaxID=2681965 RepID=A0A6L6U9E1_9FLAO|nr:DUF6515 family protein [Winogradskyella endarachnes]MUU78639.1 hypothetical protein [Winogradskyella endarachnes]